MVTSMVGVLIRTDPVSVNWNGELWKVMRSSPTDNSRHSDPAHGQNGSNCPAKNIAAGLKILEICSPLPDKRCIFWGTFGHILEMICCPAV